MTICPFCERDPFHYVDNGVGMEAVAVTCCELGIELFDRREAPPETVTISWEDFIRIGGDLTNLRFSNEKMAEALSRVAGQNDLSGVSDDAIQSAACNALYECELIARDALDTVHS